MGLAPEINVMMMMISACAVLTFVCRPIYMRVLVV